MTVKTLNHHFHGLVSIFADDLGTVRKLSVRTIIWDRFRADRGDLGIEKFEKIRKKPTTTTTIRVGGMGRQA